MVAWIFHIESLKQHGWLTKIEKVKTLWITTVDAMLEACLSVYECHFLELLSATNFGDGRQAANIILLFLLEDTTCRTSVGTYIANVAIHSPGGKCSCSRWWILVNCAENKWTLLHEKTMVAEFLWDVLEECSVILDHGQSLFIRHNFPPLQVGNILTMFWIIVRHVWREWCTNLCFIYIGGNSWSGLINSA
jgi:hypothetical protein